MVERRPHSSLARRALVFLLAFAAAWALSGYLLPDGAALAQKSAKKGSKKAKVVDEDPCANFEFEMMPLNEEAGKGAGREAAVTALQTGNLSPGSEAAFDAFFAEYQLPRLTQCKEIYHPQGMQRLVKELKGNIEGRSKPVRDRLNAIVLREGQKIAAGNYHPAARYNAMLLIAELNADEGDAAAKSPPTPYADALPVMLAAFADDKQHDVVKTAALIGIDRHVRSGAAGNEAPLLTTAMIALVSQKTPPAGRSTDAHDWMRGQAANILGTLRGTGPKNEVITALETVVNDAEASGSLRARAARALGALDYSKAKQVDPSNVAAQIAAMAVSLYSEEKKQKDRANEFPNRRLVKFWFQSANTGLVGIGGADNKESLLSLAKTAGEPHAKFVGDLATQLQAVSNHEMFDTDFIEPTKLATNFVLLTGNVRKLETYLKANRPKKPAAAVAASATGDGKAAAAAATPPAAAAGPPAAPAAPPAAAPAAKQ